MAYTTYALFYSKRHCRMCAYNDCSVMSIATVVLVSHRTLSFVSVYMRSIGMSTADHPIKKELQRVQSYFKKLQEIEERALGRG